MEEGSSQESTKVLTYLQETKSHIQPFIESRTSDLARKVNKEDCIEFFKRNGFFRSYTIRQTIAGKRKPMAEKPEKSELLNKIPTRSPPKKTKSNANDK